jgi:hypothetical protein
MTVMSTPVVVRSLESRRIVCTSGVPSENLLLPDRAKSLKYRTYFHHAYQLVIRNDQNRFLDESGKPSPIIDFAVRQFSGCNLKSSKYKETHIHKNFLNQQVAQRLL